MGESKFDKLADKIAKEYRKDGDSAEKAKEIGEATAAKIGFAKYGKRGMERKARAGRDAESFSAECVCGITCVCDCGCAESGVCDCGPSCPCSCGCGIEVETHDAESKRRGPYVFPKRKAYPIGNLEHAKLALTFSTWPDNKKDAKKVRDVVFKRYPQLRDWFKDGKYAKHAETFEADSEESKVLRQIKEIIHDPSDLNTHEAFERIKYLMEEHGFATESFDAPIEGYWGSTVDSLIQDLERFKQGYSGDMPVTIRSGIGWSGVSIDNIEFQEYITTPEKLLAGGDEYDSDREEIRDALNDNDIETIDVLALSATGDAGVSRWGAESFDAEKIEGQTQSNIYAKFFVGHVSNDELRGNGKFKTYDSAVKKAKEVAKKEGNSRVVSPMGAALWTSNDKGLFQAGHLTKEAKRFYNSEEEMATGYLSAESTLYEAPMGIYDEYCIRQGPFCVMERLPGKTLCVKCDEEFGELFPHEAEYTALGVPMRRVSARDIMSPSSRILRNGVIVLAGLMILSTATQASSPKREA